MDPLESVDSDSDGVGDNSDSFPFDSKRYEVENSDNVTLLSVFVIIFITFVIFRSKL